jgi:hypothetical protein
MIQIKGTFFATAHKVEVNGDFSTHDTPQTIVWSPQKKAYSSTL